MKADEKKAGSKRARFAVRKEHEFFPKQKAPGLKFHGIKESGKEQEPVKE